MGVVTFILTALVFTVFGMVIMVVKVSKEWYDATTEAYNVGYSRGVEKAKERIGKLLDKYAKDLEKEKL